MPRPMPPFCFAFTALAACGGVYTVDPHFEYAVVIDPAEVYLGNGGSVQLHGSVTGHPATEPILWSVADPDLVSVDATGLISTDPCGRPGNTIVTATWAAHPETWTRANVHVLLQLIIRTSIESITNAGNSQPVAREAVSGTVDVGAAYSYGACLRIHGMSLIVTSGTSETVVASVALNPDELQTAPVILRWDTRGLSDGDYALAVEANLGGRQERSPAIPIRVVNSN